MLAEASGLVHRMNPVLFELGPIRLWYYGLAYFIGFLTVHLWVRSKRNHLGWSEEDVIDFSLLFTTSVLLVGRAFDIAVYEWVYYRGHPKQLLSFWRGGMATHGVLLGAVLGLALFCRWRNKGFLIAADELVIPGSVLMALGRIGNHINGEVYGSMTSLGWAVEFPYASGFRHPVALYDGLKNLLLVPILLHIRRTRNRPDGLLTGHFIFWYGCLRFFVDYFRDYDSYWFGVGRGQYFNVLMAAAGVAMIATIRRTGRPASADPPAQQTSLQERGYWLFVKRVLFYALVGFCLTIPSGWTQAVLEVMRVRAGG